jgi:hypothetical protein
VFNGDEQVIKSSVRRSSPVFHHAVFAGNSSGDPAYTMNFGGSGSDADVVNGSLYSGGNIDVAGDATVTGDVRAQGTITGTTGDSGVSQPIFDFRGIDFTDPAITDVAAEFALEATSQYDDAGGTADQLPATNPAHILRRNPTDRPTENSSTVKDDYYLEDPYEPIGVDPSQDGSDPYVISIDTGSAVWRRTYYIDGNLWLHNRPSYSFQFETHAGLGVQITFIVRGNIIFSDNLFYEQTDKDAVAFVALKDENVEDSGNIYFGDPRGGTLVEMHAFMYAENDFYDLNLDAGGSDDVRLLGAMTAGNHVAIDRDHAGGGHSKLIVDWDPRLQTEAVTLPLISTDLPEDRYLLEAWIEDAR